MGSMDIAAKRKPDQLRFSYALLVLSYFILLAFYEQIDRISDLWVLLVLIYLAVGFALSAALLVWLIVHLSRHQWQSAASVVLAPVLAACPLFLLGHLGITPTWLRFQLDRPHFEHEIAKLDQPAGTPKLVSFDWGGRGSAIGPNFFYTVVYDESDEIALAPAQRSDDWKRRAASNPTLQGLMQGPQQSFVDPLGGHFYEVEEIYE